MSWAEVFSYALMLKGADRTERILELLDERKREELRSALEGLRAVPVTAIRQRWSEGRKADELVIAAST